MSNNNNVLDPSAILHSTSQVTIRLNNPHDAIAAACHAVMLSVGFRFAGLGDDARQEGDGTTTKLPENWNANGPHNYNFRYSHPQSSLTFVIKIVRLGDKCVILGLGIGDDKTAILDIRTEDYTSESFFPYDKNATDQPLVHGFISSNRFNDFIKTYKLNILQKLIPGLNKPGYEDQSGGSAGTRPSSSSNQSQQQQRQPLRNRFGDDDDDLIYADVGGSDLNPLGGGLRLPGFGGGNPSGMYVGPDHPIFGNRRNDNDPTGIFGGPENLPRGAVPPGARFDPIGPFGRLPVRPPPGGGGGGRGSGTGGPGTGGGPRNFSGEPDNDELMPPGYSDNMFG